MLIAWGLIVSLAAPPAVLAPGARVRRLSGGFAFAEGPVGEPSGDLVFTDLRRARIHRWSVQGQLTLVRANSGGANGLAFDARGRLLACEGERRRVTATDADGRVTVLADRYDGKRLNSPNDLWVDPRGGVYFTDPRYFKLWTVEQDGFHVYYLPPNGAPLRRVLTDLKMPNGVTGTPDGRRLYVADHGAGRVYVYRIERDGALTARRLFAREKVDGMTLDAAGNVYMAARGVVIYAPDGRRLARLPVPERPTNLAFAGAEKKTLFITARTSLYAARIR